MKVGTDSPNCGGTEDVGGDTLEDDAWAGADAWADGDAIFCDGEDVRERIALGGDNPNLLSPHCLTNSFFCAFVFDLFCNAVIKLSSALK